MKRIGLISDTHGHFDDKYEKYFAECDEIWHAGDIGDVCVTDQLKKIAPLRAVYGNIDGHVLRAEFPEHRRFVLEGVEVWLTHMAANLMCMTGRLEIKLPRNPHSYLFVDIHTFVKCKWTNV